MRLVVFSDIHGNSYALNVFLEKIKKISYDYLVFCGDIFGYYYNQKEILKQLSNLDRLIWLRGNHDDYFLNIYAGKTHDEYYIEQYGHSYDNLIKRYSKEEAELIASHGSEYVLEKGNCRVGIFHGTPLDTLEGRLYPDKPFLNIEEYQKYNIIILGHTHCRMLRKTGDTLVVNPGSLGQPRDGRGYSFAVIDTISQSVEFKKIEFDQTLLYQQIDQFDPDLKKLKEVLERRV